MSEFKNNPITRRDALKFIAGLAAGGIGGFSLSKDKGSPQIQASHQEIPFRASISQRKNLPAKVRQELYVQDPKLESLVAQDGFIAQMIDMPTDWISLYVEKMRNLGHPLPDNVQAEIRTIFDATSKQIDKALEKVK